MTLQQVKALDFIRARIAATGVPPTLAELAQELGLRAKSGAHRLIEQLVLQGAVIRAENCARGLRLVGQPTLAAVPTVDLLAEISRRSICADGATHTQRRN